MAAHRRTLHPKPVAERREVETIGLGLAFFGLLALAGGTWGLREPEALARLVQAMLADAPIRFAALLVLGAAFLAVAAYVTLHWQSLRWWELAAGWLLVGWLWAGGVAVIYATRFQFSPWLVPFLASPVTQWAASLLSLAGGTVLLALAFLLWPLPTAQPRPHRQPRVVHTLHHPRPA